MYQIETVPTLPIAEEDASPARSQPSSVNYEELEDTLLERGDGVVRMRASDVLLLIEDIRHYKNLAEEALELAEFSTSNTRKMLDSYGYR